MRPAKTYGWGLVVRSFRRYTNFSPDQTSSIAATFTSANPADKPRSRTAFLSKSVGTLADFLGHEIHKDPS